MVDEREWLEDVHDDQSSGPLTPRRQLDAPLVAAIDVARATHSPSLQRDEPAPDPAERADAVAVAVDRRLHGTPEHLGPAELRRAALLRLIGLSRFSGPPVPK